MIAILIAIWEFLVAFGPLLSAIGAALAQLIVALYELVKIAAVVTVFIAAVEVLFDPRGRARVGNLVYNLTAGGLGMAEKTLADLTPALASIAGKFGAAIGEHGDTLAGAVGGDFQALANKLLTAQRAAFVSLGKSTPENAIGAAAEAFTVAFGAGLSSAAVTALFEAVFPERLNTLNGVGPMIAKMAGFDEVAANVLKPLYEAAFGKSLAYQYRSQFKPDFPDEADAASWYARGLISDDQLRAIFEVSGLKTEYEEPYVRSRYRPISPFVAVRMLEAGIFAADELTSILTYIGLRPEDQARVQMFADYAALAPYRATALSGAKRAWERGVRTDAEFDSDMEYLEVPAAARAIVKFDAAISKQEQLVEIYRKSVSAAYKFGQITDADYVPHLEAIGIAAADAEAHYALDSIAKQGRALQAAAREAAATIKAEHRAAMNAAIAQYRAGTINEAELLAALLLAGIDPAIAGFAVSIQSSRRQGDVMFVFGLTLPRDEAIRLRENVAAVEAQFKRQLIDDAAATLALSQLNIPDSNARDLLARWAALKTKPTTTGEELPR
jgi:hypothetical protein